MSPRVLACALAVAFVTVPTRVRADEPPERVIMDLEQFQTEEWHEYGHEWRPTIAGIHRYAELRRERREDRKRSWADRNEADEESDEYYRNLGGRKP